MNLFILIFLYTNDVEWLANNITVETVFFLTPVYPYLSRILF